jgi:hypothetical protein
MKKVVFLFIISPFLCITSCAQENNNLHIPQELDGMGQKVYDGFEYMYSKVSEYVKVVDKVSKADMDSVCRVAILDYNEKVLGENDSILKRFLMNTNVNGSDATKDSKFNSEQQTLIEEIGSVVKKYNPKKGLPKLANELGDINQKAAKTLSDTDATAVYAVSITTYYSTKYWLTNAQKWQALGEEVKKKNM